MIAPTQAIILGVYIILKALACILYSWHSISGIVVKIIVNVKVPFNCVGVSVRNG